MSSFSHVNYLHSRKGSIHSQIQSNTTLISDLEAKISRLQTALREISSSLTSLESEKSSIDSLSIDESSWRGKKKEDFQKKYDQFKESVKTYISNVVDAKEAIANDIKRYENEKALCHSSIASLQNTLQSLDIQIAQAQRELS
ncbi:DUF5082 domain-containing protein [Bacillus lacus]|uniref:DUF5082 domain-containing protein n=1 Tax=Metabacillus lacus TaxID=1983721 RepID=A0A7X2IZK1_9BACI|nr:DUF5082 family protein [Metabacillus lacus]MRX72691.1 DUF5082 domain-containing protein [Metabacillus lacus]